MDFTGFYWVLPGFIVFEWISTDFIGLTLNIYQVLSSLLGFTGFYWVYSKFLPG